MNLEYYVVDAFATKVFEGNPAAVFILPEWLPEELMQKIAIENNLSETAFAVKQTLIAFAGLRQIVKLIFADMQRWQQRLCCFIIMNLNELLSFSKQNIADSCV